MRRVVRRDDLQHHGQRFRGIGGGLACGRRGQQRRASGIGDIVGHVRMPGEHMLQQPDRAAIGQLLLQVLGALRIVKQAGQRVSGHSAEVDIAASVGGIVQGDRGEITAFECLIGCPKVCGGLGLCIG